ncbi:MAG TPA: cohesin domain-containing protein, partial [Chitinophagales bacterium]|nr:cohesin domain-containing protein [Chitinophagales bacterium]
MFQSASLRQGFSAFSLTLLLLFSSVTGQALTLSMPDVSGTPGSQVNVPVTVTDFVNLITAQGTIEFDPLIAEFDTVVGYNLPGLTFFSFDISQANSGIITYSWDDASFAGVTRTNGSPIFTLVFTVVGTAGQQTDVSFTGSVTVPEFLDNTFAEVTASFVNGSITVEQGVPSNDDCANAIAMQCGDTLLGTTTNATVDAVGFCNDINNNPISASAPGVWYSFTGTGATVTVSLCHPGTTYDSKLTVVSGTCQTFSCVLANDDFCGLQSQVTFNSTPGTNYLIYVHGFGTETGDFEISLTCESPANDDCANAEEIFCDQTVSGTTVGATADGIAFACGTTPDAPGVWYFFTGTGDDITISTCSDNTIYDTRLNVYAGSCGDFICIGGNDDIVGTCSSSPTHSEVSFSSQLGTTYFILVNGFNNQTGSFDLSISCNPIGGICSEVNELISDTVPPVENSIELTGLPGEISDLDVLVNISHTFIGDITITLTSPSGTLVTLY